jgi:hypothetical protein
VLHGSGGILAASYCFRIVFSTERALGAMRFRLVARALGGRAAAALRTAPKAKPARVPSFWQNKFGFHE